MKTILQVIGLVSLLVLSGCSAMKSDYGAAGQDGLLITDEVVGDGREVGRGDRVSVHYTGWLHDSSQKDGKGKRFDSSYDRSRTFEFTVGAGQVIRGWDFGIVGMREGGQRTLVIAPHLGYGVRGAGGVIPPDATLIFEIELVKFR